MTRSHVSHRLLLVFILFGFVHHTAASDRCESVAALERTEGQVRVTHSGQTFPQRNLTVPHDLCPGDHVQTVSNAQALIRHVGGEVVLAENSTLKVLAVDKLSLEQGVALFEIAKREGKSFVAQTPLIVIGVKGTRFLVNSNQQRDDVALFNGLVAVTQTDGDNMAYFRAKPLSEMSFEEYRTYQQRAFSDYRDAINQAFNDYKKQTLAEFESFVNQIDLQPGRQLTIGATKTRTEAVDAQINPAFETLNKTLGSWLP